MPRMRPLLQLRARITLLVSLILGLALLVTGILVDWKMEQQARDALGEKVVLLSRIMAESEVVRDGLTGRRPQAQVQALAEQVRLAAGADYVSVCQCLMFLDDAPAAAALLERLIEGSEARASAARPQP